MSSLSSRYTLSSGTYTKDTTYNGQPVFSVNKRYLTPLISTHLRQTPLSCDVNGATLPNLTRHFFGWLLSSNTNTQTGQTETLDTGQSAGYNTYNAQ